MSWLITPQLKRPSAAVTDPDARAYLFAVEQEDGQFLEAGVATAVNNFVTSCKADGIWTPAVQILLPCGARTLAGALVSLKGPASTNNGPFVSGDYNRKTGLGATSNTSKWLDSNVAQNSLPNTTHGIGWYGNISESTGDKALFGAYNSTSGSALSLLLLDAWTTGYTPTGRAFRCGTYTQGQFPLSSSTAAASCMVATKQASNNAAIYLDGVLTTSSTSITPVFENRNLGWFALNQVGSRTGFTSSKLQVGGIFNTGLSSTNAEAFRTAAATYVAAINVAF